MMNKYLVLVTFFLCCCSFSTDLLGQNTSAETTNANEQANSSSITTGRTDFIRKYELYGKLQDFVRKQNLNWNVVERDSNIVLVFRQDVVLVPQGTEAVTDSSNVYPTLADEYNAMKEKYGTKPYEITLSLEPFPKSKYLNIRDKNSALLADLDTLQNPLNETIPKADPSTRTYFAMDKEEKDELVSFLLIKKELEKQVVFLPPYYLEDYGLTFEYDSAYQKAYPVNLKNDTNKLIQFIEDLILNGISTKQ